jgi:hypothetical protein
MIRIAHRGIIKGPSVLENVPDRVLETLKEGYDAEIDVWYGENGWSLGHDHPMYDVSLDFLKTKGLWVHCKNSEAFMRLLKFPEINCFMHDDVSWKNGVHAVTSQKFLWVYPEVYTFDGALYGRCGSQWEH